MFMLAMRPVFRTLAATTALAVLCSISSAQKSFTDPYVLEQNGAVVGL
ncbi:MAG: hypothetical protein QOJ65_707, partial [Fimbriimonadaceae bacterium]|nr:hypothetical protein [Fimbriimonadaceae bacterium]